jgi:hypothetical protein
LETEWLTVRVGLGARMSFEKNNRAVGKSWAQLNKK